MKEDEVLVVKLNVFLSISGRKSLYDDLLEQTKKGLIILPPSCDAIIVPKDTPIKIVDNVDTN